MAPVQPVPLLYAGAMANRYDPGKLTELTDWAQQAAEALNLEPLSAHDIDTVLSESARASADLVRSAGPVAMYLAGTLVATGQAADVGSACRIVRELMSTLGADEVQHQPQSTRD